MTDPLSLSTLGLSLAAGALTTLSPCVFPVLPLVLGGAVQANRLAPLAMGLGMAGSFALIGMLLGSLGPLLDVDGDGVRLAGGVLLAALGLVLLVPAWSQRFAQWMLPVASGAGNVSNRLDSGTLGGALLLGALLGLIWSPCSGPLLAAALTLVASEGGVLRGGLILGLFGLGAATPLVAVAYASRAGFMAARAKVLARVEALKKIFGALLLLTGIAIVSGADKWLEARIVERLPDAWVRLTTLF